MPFWTTTMHDSLAVLEFTRPPRNFMSFAALGELEANLTELATREDVAVILLTSGLPGYFVAHADLDDLARAGRGEPVEGLRSSWRTAPAAIEAIPQPVIAAVHGQAWGGGTELALACTLRVCSESSSFGLPEINVAQIPGAGGTQRLPRLIGAGRALDMLLSGRKVGAAEALQFGLVNQVLPDEDFARAAIEWAQTYANHYRPALAAVKRVVIDGLRRPFDEGIALEHEHVVPRTGDPVSLAAREELATRYANTPATEVVDF